LQRVIASSPNQPDQPAQQFPHQQIVADGARPLHCLAEGSDHADQPFTGRRVSQLDPGGGAIVEIRRRIKDERWLGGPEDQFAAAERQNQRVLQDAARHPQPEQADGGFSLGKESA
jgi:hypothetical protein